MKTKFEIYTLSDSEPALSDNFELDMPQIPRRWELVTLGTFRGEVFEIEWKGKQVALAKHDTPLGESVAFFPIVRVRPRE